LVADDLPIFSTKDMGCAYGRNVCSALKLLPYDEDAKVKVAKGIIWRVTILGPQKSDFGHVELQLSISIHPWANSIHFHHFYFPQVSLSPGVP